MRPFAVGTAVLVLGAALACTRNPGTAETTEGVAGVREPGASVAGSRVEAEVVSTNPAAQMLTVRPTTTDAAGSGAVETALPVQGEAAARLLSLRSGDRVMLTCEAVPGSPADASPRDTPEGMGTAAVDAGVLGVPCPAVIRIDKVG